jgi:hypothetical protein
MALPESLTSDAQSLFGHAAGLHQPRVLLAPALAGSVLLAEILAQTALEIGSGIPLYRVALTDP